MTALLVEDEPMIAMMAVGMLNDLGFTVFEARTKGEATKILSEENGLSLLFTDIELADGTSGVDLATEVAMHFPEMQIVVTSGRTRPTVLPRGAQFVPKPYTELHLAKAFRC